jgi:hypothetical protein
MNRAAAITLPLNAATSRDAFDALRQLIVLGCALSLILAGRALPF